MPSSGAKQTTPKPLKQSSLSFSAKRIGTTAAKKNTNTSSLARSSSTLVESTSPSSCEISRNVVIVDEAPGSGARKISERTDTRSVKRRRLAKNEVDNTDTSGVFRSRERQENTDDGSTVEVVHAGLDELRPDDPKWNTAYKQARVRMGNSEPIHAQGQTKVHHILRVFDLSYEYGPCVGVSRLERWERAKALGLSPPPEVKEILSTKQGLENTNVSQSIFYGEV